MKILGRRGTYAPRGASGKKLKPRKRRNAVDPLALTPGDYVVHERHGIGNFIEMVSRPVAGVSSKHGETPLKEYLVIEYAPSKRGGPLTASLYPPISWISFRTMWERNPDPL